MFGILGQTANALDYAHSKGIVHRDIKPANIMIAADGSAKITDFGIAKITASEQFTMTGSIVGTPHYMSPEQVQGQPVDGRSDQFSLAVIAFEMLTGEKPYTGEHLTTVVYKIVAEEPQAPHRINPSLTGPIETVLRKGLAKKADARYKNCQEFADALEKACNATKSWKALPRGGSLNAPTMADAPKPSITLPPSRRARSNGDTTVAGPEKKKSSFLPFLLAVLMAALLLALIGWQAMPWLTDRQGEQSKTAQVEKPGPTQAQAQSTQQQAPPQAQPLSPEDAKPSPMPAPVQAAPAAPPAQTAADEGTKPAVTGELAPAPKHAADLIPVAVSSSPVGATAKLDGRGDATCATPCTLNAPPGRHTVEINLAGYQPERREILVGSTPVEVDPIALRGVGGTLMLSSSPTGASVKLDGKPTAYATPARIALAPGTYKITVEKDGRQSTQTVEIRNGQMSSLKILLD